MNLDNLFVIDVETTGPDPFLHELISVALVPFQQRVESLLVLVRPSASAPWDSWAKKAHRDFLAAAPDDALDPADAHDRIQQYVNHVGGGRSITVLGHNVGFDLAFLRGLAHRAGRPAIAGISHRAVDTHTLLFVMAMQGRIDPAHLSSDGAFERFGITAENRHEALGDAVATRELAQLLLRELVASSVR